MEKAKTRNGIISLALLIAVVWIMVISLLYSSARANAQTASGNDAAPVVCSAEMNGNYEEDLK